MPSYNKCIFVGHLTRDPAAKQLPGGSSVCEFGLAVNHKFKSRDGSEREEVLFIDCACFGKGGEVVAQYCRKGKPLLVEGRLKLDSWEAQDGTKRSKHSLVVDNFQFLGGRDDADDGGGAPAQRAPQRSAPARQPAGGGRGRQAPVDPPFGDDHFDESSIPFFWRDHRTAP